MSILLIDAITNHSDSFFTTDVSSDVLENDILSHEKSVDSEVLPNDFDDLEARINDSLDPIAEAYAFLQTFIDQINKQYGLNLTIPQMCQLAKEKDYLQLSIEKRDDFFSIINLLASENQFKEKHKKHCNYHCSWPFGDAPETKPKRVSLSERIQAGTIVGAIEVIAGASIGICCGSTIVGGVIAGGLVADGLRRLADEGQSEVDFYLKERKSIDKVT